MSDADRRSAATARWRQAQGGLCPPQCCCEGESALQCLLKVCRDGALSNTLPHVLYSITSWHHHWIGHGDRYSVDAVQQGHDSLSGRNSLKQQNDIIRNAKTANLWATASCRVAAQRRVHCRVLRRARVRLVGPVAVGRCGVCIHRLRLWRELHVGGRWWGAADMIGAGGGRRRHVGSRLRRWPLTGKVTAVHRLKLNKEKKTIVTRVREC